MDKGTTVSIRLPEQKAPSWFVEKLVLENKSSVVVLDDDHSVHGVWGQRFAAEKFGEKGIELLHFSNPRDFRKWHAKLDKGHGPVVYLSDFELLGYPETGLDVIRELGLDGEFPSL